MTKIDVRLGATINTGNFQSLRIDIGVEDEVRKDEHIDQAFDRVYKYVEHKLDNKISEAVQEISGE